MVYEASIIHSTPKQHIKPLKKKKLSTILFSLNSDSRVPKTQMCIYSCVYKVVRAKERGMGMGIESKGVKMGEMRVL